MGEKGKIILIHWAGNMCNAINNVSPDRDRCEVMGCHSFRSMGQHIKVQNRSDNWHKTKQQKHNPQSVCFYSQQV